MGESYLVVDNLKFAYEGLFNPEEIYSIITSLFYERGWIWYEKMNQEEVTPSGKQIRMILKPFLLATKYYQLGVQMRIHMVNLKEVEVERDGKILRLHHGVLRITYSGEVISDRKGLWKKPLFWFLSVVFEKYFFSDRKEKYSVKVKETIDDLSTAIKNYLNTCKYTYNH